MQVNDGTQVMLGTLVEGESQQVPCLWQFVAFLIPELHLVNGNTYKVEAQRIQTGKVVLLDMHLTGLASFFTLRQPMAEVRTAMDAEVIHFLVLLTLCRAGSQNQHHQHSKTVNNSFHFSLLRFVVVSISCYFAFPSMMPFSTQSAFTFILALRSKMPKCSGPLPKLLLSHTKVEKPRFLASLTRKRQ